MSLVTVHRCWLPYAHFPTMLPGGTLWDTANANSLNTSLKIQICRSGMVAHTFNPTQEAGAGRSAGAT